LHRCGKRWSHRDYQQLQTELLELASQHATTQNVSQLFFHSSLPVDVRHNAKINREELTVWAANHTHLVPTLCVGTHYSDAPRHPLLPQSGSPLRSHAERGNEEDKQ